MIRLLFSLLSIFFLYAANASDGEFAFIKINPLLLKKANAVIRLDETRLEIRNAGKTIFKNHFVITVLNEKGERFAEFSEFYNKFRDISDIEGHLYDANGKELKKVKKKDIMDMTGRDDFSLIDDTRYKQHKFYYKVYPYTVEYSYEVSSNSTLQFPQWTPLPSEGIASEKSTMEIEYPLDYTLRYKSFNYKNEPELTKGKSSNILTWKIENLPAVWRESYAPLWHELTPMAIFGPDNFEIDEYKGNMQSWQEFGKFVYQLKQGKDALPDELKKTVHTIADPVSDPKEKIRLLYEYMQHHTRYIGIQLGIGGFRPFDAKEVSTKGYGDCKALSNFMYSLLKEVNIPSFYTLVYAGESKYYITEDFPSQQFNHVILCVPLGKDTTWLECTDQTLESGYLGNFTDNRPALLITENGGILVKTPKYSMNDNAQLRKIKATIDEEGNLLADIHTRYSGMQQDFIHSLIHQLSKDKVKEYLHEELDFATFDVNSFEYTTEKLAIPAINEKLNIFVSGYATITGKRIFINPNIMTKISNTLSTDSSRKYDVLLTSEYVDIDSLEIQLPAGYSVESLPKDVQIDSKFGKYTSSVKFESDKLLYYRKMERNSGRFPPASYQDLANFYNSISKADKSKVVLVKK